MNEVEKLQNAAALIEEITQGRQTLKTGIGGGYIANSDDANFGMQMRVRSGADYEHYHITFDAFVRQMGVTMDSSSVKALVEEASQMEALLTALEMQEFQPSLMQFQQFLAGVEQQEQQNSLTMGQTF